MYWVVDILYSYPYVVTIAVHEYCSTGLKFIGLALFFITIQGISCLLTRTKHCTAIMMTTGSLIDNL